MSISEKLTDIKFTKSAIGYSAKEVDGFISDILPLVKEQEHLLLALKVKLEAFDAQRGEIEGKEKQALRLLEAAKKEAEIIVATAKKSAEDKLKDAELSSEVQLRAAASRAAEIIADAEQKAKATANEAEVNAEKVLKSADAEARAVIEKVMAYSTEETRKAQEISDKCAAFEANFKALVAKTAAEFAAIKENAPMPAREVVEEPAPIAAPCAEPQKEETEAEAEAEVEEPTFTAPTVGERARTPKKHLYDAVPVTYDDDEQDFTDIRDIMKRAEKRKSPTHFSE
ncbi:MAG: hypothetical protein IKY12_05880 [Clostridia bacterium]|nr:hypothetical protein [Clostridia bacterium]